MTDDTYKTPNETLALTESMLTPLLECLVTLRQVTGMPWRISRCDESDHQSSFSVNAVPARYRQSKLSSNMKLRVLHQIAHDGGPQWFFMAKTPWASGEISFNSKPGPSCEESWRSLLARVEQESQRLTASFAAIIAPDTEQAGAST